MKDGFVWINNPIEAKFLDRLNRFACLVELGGDQVKVYLPNSGRLEELLIPGSPIILEKRRSQGKTHHDLLLIQTPRFPDGLPIWAVLDSRLPSALLEWILRERFVDDFGELIELKHEPRVPMGRLDLFIRSGDGIHYIETKSVNLLDQKGIARFPDAPSSRGTKHLKALMDLTQEAISASIVFIVMREDALSFSPFEERDPLFTNTLSEARGIGVNIKAYKFAAGPVMSFLGELPIEVPGPPFSGFW